MTTKVEKITQWPWTISQGPFRKVIKGSGKKGTYDGRSVCIIESWTTDPDANLICAAPELLGALKQLVERAANYISCSEAERDFDEQDNYDAMRDARAAIAKAEGTT